MEEFQTSLCRSNVDLYVFSLRNSHFFANVNCSMCQTTVVPAKEIALLFCSHIFHANCVENWLRRVS